MISLNKIYKTYENVTVLKNITLSINKGTITGIIGPNGAGKSTLLKIITGIEYPNKGEIYIDNMHVMSFNHIKPFISYMPERMTIYPEYHVYEYIDFLNKVLKIKNTNLFNLFFLENIYTKRIKHLSKGWHQRLKLYTALSIKRPVYILDEPFEGFDPLQMQHIIEILLSFVKQSKTIILSIHELSYAQRICNDFILLNKGEVVAQGTLNELKEKYSVKENTLEKIFIKALEG